MEANAPHEHHEMRASGRALTQVAISATLHCRTAAGHEVRISGETEHAGRESELHFAVPRSGQPARLAPYLGARGHLVALREGDLAFLHVHPVEGGEGGNVTFATEFPTAGRYRLILQYKEAGAVRTAEFTRQVRR